jgi:hypothetical protein
MDTPLLGNRAKEFLQKISKNIIHIYGQVGKFKWQGGEGSENRTDDDYGRYKDDVAFSKASGKGTTEKAFKNMIFVIGDDRADEVRENVRKAIEWLNSSEVIFFLGFGFNDDNIDLLNLKQNTKKAEKIYCTNYGDSQIITEKINKHLIRGSGEQIKTSGGISGGERKPTVSTENVYNAVSTDFNLLA